jgi:predicted MFS family arabinose efflux permease
MSGPRPEDRLRNLGLLLALGLGAFSIGTDSLVITGLLDRIGADLDVSTAATGQLITAFALVYGLGAPVMATLMPRLDRKLVLLAGLSLLACANVVSAVAPNYGVLMTGRIIAALGSALYIPSALMVAVSVTPERFRGRAIAIVAGGISSATALGVPLGTLIGAVGSWRATFLLVAILGSIALTVLAVSLPRIPAPPVVRIRRRMQVIAHPGILAALVSYLLACSGEFAFLVYIAPATRGITGFAGAGLSAFLFLYGISSVAGSIFGGWASDAFGGTSAYVGASAVLFMSLASMALLSTFGAQRSWFAVVLFAALLCIMGIGSWALSPAQSHRVSGMDSPDTTVALSLNGSASYLGLALGGALGGLVMSGGSTAALAGTAVVLEALALIAFVAVPRLVPAGRSGARAGP